MEKRMGIEWYREKREEIRKLNLTSDLLSSVVFEDKLALQDVLRILTGIHELKVTRVEPQRSYRNLYGHGSVADVWAEDECHTQYNMEIQIAENEDHLRRSRFIQSRIDSRVLNTGISYGKLPELYMIFITEKDFLRAGNSLAEVVRTIKGTRKQIDNGVHEIYVNLEHSSENEELQRLLSYFRHTEEDGVSVEGFRHLAERVRYLKKEEGVKDMCELMEREWAAGRAVGWVDGRAEGKIEDILDILSEIGIVSSDLRKKVSQETDVAVLGRWVCLAARVRNVSDFERKM